MQQSWSLPYTLQRTSAFGDVAATSNGFTGRVVSPQVDCTAECEVLNAAFQTPKRMQRAGVRSARPLCCS